MKNILNRLLILSLLVTVFASCKKDENKDYFVGGTDPVLNASTTNPFVLIQANKAQFAIKFAWTNPNYQFTTGLSSQDVTYTLQVDTTADFSSPNLKEQAITKNLSVNFTVGDFNLLFAAWQENVPHDFNFRLKASLSTGTGILYSNTVKITVTPYLDVAVPLPVTGTGNDLYLIGSATPGGDATGWNNPVPVPSQRFTKMSSTVWKITIPLIGGKQYLVIPDNGSWSHKYAVDASSVTWNGGNFGYDKNDNFPGPPTSGTYTITVNFKTGKFTVTQ